MQHFIHSGELGDVIYSLPCVKAMGGGAVDLLNSPGMTMHEMTWERAMSLAPLLKIQPYVTGVNLHTGPVPFPAVDLNRFRTMGFDLCSTNLTHHYFRANGLAVPAYEPWLTVENWDYPTRPVVFARSARYHNPLFPWQKVADAYRGRAVFVGTPDEHAAFVTEFGDVEYVETPTLLDAACVIAGADLFVGNQSCPLAIAHGLGQRVLIEVCPYCPNCLFNRPGEYAASGPLPLIAA